MNNPHLLKKERYFVLKNKIRYIFIYSVCEIQKSNKIIVVLAILPLSMLSKMHKACLYHHFQVSYLNKLLWIIQIFCHYPFHYIH